jgi:FkbM family methyltransferase
MDSKDFSQGGEQRIIEQLFSGTNGRLMDIGAWVPDSFSNSRALIDAGWRAVLVEPAPIPFKALLDYYGDSPNVELVNAAVGQAAGLVPFYDSGGDAISTTDSAHRDKWHTGSGCHFKKYWLQPLAMGALFDRFGFDFDFINLDVEATNWDNFRSLPFSKLVNLKAMCVEHDGMAQTMGSYVSGYGFQLVFSNAENVILARST